jgi:tetratricopeptide (TPR) repeat protein
MKNQGQTAKDMLGDLEVLVLEPSANYRASIKSFLSNLKIGKARYVSTVKEAKIALLTVNVGFFICEWGLKDTNGIQFCRDIRLQKKYERTPFLLMSVENLRKDVVLASEVGIDGYLLKPFSYEEFRESVVNVLKAAKQPTNTNRRIVEAQGLLRRSEVAKAEEIYSQIQNEAPQSARALHGLAQIADKKGDHGKAVEHLKAAHVLNPDYVDALRDLIEILLIRGPTRELIEYATKAHDMSPENPKYTLILAKALLEDEEYELSERFFKKTIRLSPKLAQAYKGLGRLYMIQDDYDSAMKNFEKSLDLDDQDVSTLNSLGMTYVKQGKFAEGIVKYQAALRIKPDDARIIFNLGYAKEKLNDLESARYFYKQALLLMPGFDKADRRLKALA